MATYIVTGGAGFIGCNIARELVRQKQKVIILDNLSTGNIDNIADIKDDAEFIKGDIRNLELLKKIFKRADFVLHQAALGSVPRSVEDPINTHENNATGTLNVLLAARDNGIKRVVYASSSSIYGGVARGKNREHFRPNPLSPYAASKTIGEHYFKIFHDLYKLETVILRYFNVYGPYQSPNSAYAAAVPLFIQKAVSGQKPVIYGDGNQSRSFTFVNDVVAANIAACQKKGAAGKTMNIGGHKTVSVNKIWETIAKITGAKIKPHYAPARTGEIYHSAADISRAKKYLDYEPQYDIKKGLEETIEWHQKFHSNK